MPLQITSIDPEYISAEQGEQIDMSCLVNYGNDYSYFDGWIRQSGDGTMIQTNNSTEIDRTDGGQYYAVTQSYKDLKLYGTSLHTFKLYCHGTSGSWYHFYGFKAVISIPAARSLYDIRIGYLDKVHIAIDRTVDYDIDFDIIHNTLEPLDVSAYIVFDNVTPSTVTISQNGVVLYSCSKVVVINTTTAPTRLVQYGYYGTTLSTFDFKYSTSIPTIRLLDKSNDSILSTSSPYTYTAKYLDNGKNFQWEATYQDETVLSNLIPVEVELFQIDPEYISAVAGEQVGMSCEISGEGGSVNWAQSTLPSHKKWNSITYGNGKFVAVAFNTNVSAYSFDGINWVETVLPSSQLWYSITYGGGKFVAVAHNTDIYAYSLDGINWVQSNMPYIHNWFSVAYGGGKFVAVAHNTNVSAYSPDGITWTQATLPFEEWMSVTYGGGKFVAVAYSTNVSAYSLDGINWVQSNMPSSQPWYSVTYGGGKFVAVTYSTNVSAYSFDGINWVETVLPSSQPWRSLAYGNGKFVVVAYNTDIYAYSLDGINWVQSNMPSYQSWTSVTYKGSKFVAVAYDTTVSAYSVSNLKLLDTSNGSILSIGSPYTYTAKLADNGKNFQWEATYQDGTALSNLIPVEVELASIVKGNGRVFVLPKYGYKTTINLFMEKSIDSRGLIRWLDYGKEYDSISSSITIATEKGKELENLFCDDSTDQIYFKNGIVEGVFPFSAMFLYSQNYPISIKKWRTNGDRTILGEQTEYELEIVPTIQDIYSLTAQTEMNHCIVSAWQIGGVAFPFTVFDSTINDKKTVIQFNGAVSEIVDSTRDFGDIAEITVNCTEEQSRLILNFLTGTMRGTEQLATFPDSFHIFGRRYEGMSSCQVKLFDSILEVVHNSYNSVDITFSLQMVSS